MGPWPQTQHWRVIDVREGKTEPNPHGGMFQKFYVDFEDAPDTYWRRNQGDAPEVGKTYYGRISKGDYGLRFKKEKVPDDHNASGGFQPRSPASSQPQSTSKASSSGETDWNVRNAEIRRQHSQQVAIEWCSFLDGSPDWDELVRVIDLFDQDAIAAGQKASVGEQPIDFQGARQSEPQTTQRAAPPSEFPDRQRDKEEFMQLLDSKGITNPIAAGDIADYYMTMDAQRQLKCGNALMAAEFTGALDSLVGMTESWMGKALPPLVSPLPADDPSIPF